MGNQQGSVYVEHGVEYQYFVPHMLADLRVVNTVTHHSMFFLLDIYTAIHLVDGQTFVSLPAFHSEKDMIQFAIGLLNNSSDHWEVYQAL